ncbi:MAG: hypothetical protein V1894_02555 [Chloroflexota bacterium]
MTIKEKTVFLTAEDIQSARLNGYQQAQLELALAMAGYRLVIEPSQTR